MKNYLKALFSSVVGPQAKAARGFTMIELLVVIAIIAVLTALILAALNSSQKGGRDSQRRSDLKQLGHAVQGAVGDGLTLPTGGASGLQQTADKSQNTIYTAFTSYLSQPVYPPNAGATANKTYLYFGNSPAYIICVQLEKNSKWLYQTTNGQTDTNVATCTASGGTGPQ